MARYKRWIGCLHTAIQAASEGFAFRTVLAM